MSKLRKIDRPCRSFPPVYIGTVRSESCREITSPERIQREKEPPRRRATAVACPWPAGSAEICKVMNVDRNINRD